MVKLGDVIDYGAAQKAEPRHIPADAWVLELEDIERDTSRILERRTFSERQSKSTKHSFRSGDVLYGKLRPYLNKVVLADTPGFCTTEVVPLRPNEVVDGAFLFWWLKHPEFLKYVNEVSHGVNMPRLGTEAGRAAPFVLAPLNEQRRIVARIEELTARSKSAREALQAIPPLLEKFRQSVLAAAFRGDLTAEWRRQNPDVEPAEVLLERIRVERRRRWEESGARGKYVEPEPVDATGLPALPRGWCWARLDDCGRMMRGKSRHRPRNDSRLFEGGQIPFIQTGDVANSRGGVVQSAGQFYNEFGLSQSRLFSAGTVCITIAANIAESAILGIDACFPDSVVGLIPASFVTPHYLEFFIRSVRQRLADFAPATAQKNLNNQLLGQVPVPIPPLGEMHEIVVLLQVALDQADGQSGLLRDLSSLIAALDSSVLARAFRGELVPQDPDDEPASVLLTRLRDQRPDVSQKRRRK